MATASKIAYLKRYMSKEDLADFKMKRKVKSKVLSDLEKRQAEGGQGLTTSGNVYGGGMKKSGQSKKAVPAKKRHDSDSDQTPPRKNSSVLPIPSRQHGSDSDASPLRKCSQVVQSKKCHDSDSDQSPLRKNSNHESKKRHDSDSDQSPPCRNVSGIDSKRRHDSDSDQSPPRRNVSGDDRNPTSRRGDRPSRFSDLSPKENNSSRATKTMSGATAGLSSAMDMKREAKRLKEKEEKAFKKMDDDILGKNAKTVMRDRETGKRRNLNDEKKADEEEERKKEEQRLKYQQWGKGLSQNQEREKRLAEQVHEASKPLARYKDDHDLDNMLRKEERAEDPMLAFIKRKKEKEDSKGGKVKVKKELPKYKGSAPPPPNRYNILPGYRWDGVDRSNGFENKVFANINNKKAIQEMAYKWSTEDM